MTPQLSPQRPDHDFDAVEVTADGYVLVCTCGWASPADESAEAVGTAWDVHRAAAGAEPW